MNPLAGVEMGGIPLGAERGYFSVYNFSPCLQIALALGTEGSGDLYRDLLINNPPSQFLQHL